MIKRDRASFKRKLTCVVSAYRKDGIKNVQCYADCSEDVVREILGSAGCTIDIIRECDIDVKISLSDMLKYGNHEWPKDFKEYMEDENNE